MTLVYFSNYPVWLTGVMYKRRRIHNGERPYKCRFCDKTFTQKGSCTNHERIHTGDKPYKCRFCDKTYKDKISCIYHERIHSGERPYKCRFCNKTFPIKGNCTNHERIHTRDKPYKCRFCDKTFKYQNSCIRHEKIHTGERPYKCRFCDKTFAQKGNCISHERIHIRDKPYKCRFCDISFTLKGNCTDHETIHGEKHNQSKHCDTEFMTKLAFTSPKRMHTCEKPYTCGIEFSQEHNCKTHETMHIQTKYSSNTLRGTKGNESGCNNAPDSEGETAEIRNVENELTNNNAKTHHIYEEERTKYYFKGDDTFTTENITIITDNDVYEILTGIKRTTPGVITTVMKNPFYNSK
ncbi:zinc finger protein 525 [Lingula anatina]|uniref:Zinc finger protein 525 n=1 Tax=Lingula anatina TaxID=7574 RepID=A0A2R2MT63_LINAN|nr:zinc finger protein 525 [Lingula anatina]|eukprot:XP_023933303.1 zinc finger protein 525 [Lingula anatina]